MESKLAINARPSHRAAKPHTLVMAHAPATPLPRRSDRLQVAIAAARQHRGGERTNSVLRSRKYARENWMRTAGL
jgi:hypothetical protein